MAGVMVSVATGVMNSVVHKLTTLLGEEYKLVGDTRRGIRFMRDELSSMNAALQRLADMDDDQIDVQTKEWRSKVRELSYDIEDCIDRFMLMHSSEKYKVSFVQSMVRKIKMLWEDHKIAKEIQKLKALVVEEKERRDRYNIDQHLVMTQHVPLDPRAPILYEETRDLVGIDSRREEIISLLKGEEMQLRVVSIFGIGGQGKTTLAMVVYRKMEELFDCRASVSVSRTPDIKKILRGILFQINQMEFDRSGGWEMEQLVPTIREYLTSRRYLIVIDDIWSTLAWEHVKCVLPTNSNGSRIITTTRNKDVAQSCCTYIDGYMYEAKPLSEEDSRRLFYRRTFPPTEDCLQELREVANDILRKCDGLPLAIISTAGLLANKSRTVEVWIKTRDYIYSAVEKNSPIDKMKRILLLSYFDLPYYLKTCLLYICFFPEDSSIDCRYLIWRWVVEGLIQGENRESMEQLATSHLNELINRSMIQPTMIDDDGTTVKSCGVHDIVRDFIISQSMEENFITVLNGNDVSQNSSNKIHRLALQSNNSEDSYIAKAMKNVSHLRSLCVFGSGYPELGKQVPRLLNLRVLNIEGNLHDFHAEQIGSLSQLKYLRLRGIQISKLPEQISNLQNLEILDLGGNCIIEKLPGSIVQLHKLVRLFIPGNVQLPDEIGNLQTLEELSPMNVCASSVKCIEGLGKLTNLRSLKIDVSYPREVLHDEGQEKACIASLSKLVSFCLQSLEVWGNPSFEFINSWMVSCGSAPPLQRLTLSSYSGTIPINRIDSLINLTHLTIFAADETNPHLHILASLPLLLSLKIYLSYYHDEVCYPRHTIGNRGFQRLLVFEFMYNNEMALTFEPKAQTEIAGTEPWEISVWTWWTTPWAATSIRPQTYVGYY